MPYCRSLLSGLPLSLKKSMEANLLFPRIVEEYKDHLRTRVGSPLSFRSFCLGYNVLPKSVDQWMRRHGLSVEILRYEVLSEGYSIASSSGALKREGERRLPAKEDLHGVSVTFPDGVMVGIRRGNVKGVLKFIDSYNRIIDRNHVQPQ